MIGESSPRRLLLYPSARRFKKLTHNILSHCTCHGAHCQTESQTRCRVGTAEGPPGLLGLQPALGPQHQLLMPTSSLLTLEEALLGLQTGIMGWGSCCRFGSAGTFAGTAAQVGCQYPPTSAPLKTDVASDAVGEPRAASLYRAKA